MSLVRAAAAALDPVRAAIPVGTPGSVYPYSPITSPVGGPTPVTEISALRYPAVYSSIRVLAESGGMLPCLTYSRQANGDRERVQDNADPRARMLRLEPNPWMTAMEMWEAAIGILNLYGNAYVFKERAGNGMISALWLLPPQATQTMRDPTSGDLYYYIVPGPGANYPGLTTSLYHSRDIMHLRGFGLDGYFGLSPISLHRRALNIGASGDQYAENFYLNDGTPGGAYTTPNELSDAAFYRLKAQIDDTHTGVGNAHKAALFEGGVSWQSTAVPNKDAQFLESRQWQIAEIARIFRVPPHMIGDLSHATFSNIEQQSIDFVTYSLQPWLTRLEQRINLEVFDSPRDEGLFAEFLVDGLLRGDTATRYAAYAQAPWMTDNEKRRRENLVSLDGLDEPTRPLNMSSVSSADSDMTSRVAVVIAAIKAGADPLKALAALGLDELVTDPAVDLLIPPTPVGGNPNG